jgi:hypothetical protein
LILGDGEGENSLKNTLHGGGRAGGEARRRSTRGAVEEGVCRAREEQCAGVKLVDVESGPDGGWSELRVPGKAYDVGRLRALLVVQRLYPRVLLRLTVILGRMKAAWWLKAAAHRRRWRRSGA